MHYNRYRNLAIGRAQLAPSDAEVAAVEDLLGAVLPESFKDFLQVANGGNIDYMVDVPMGNGKTEALSFSALFSTGGGKPGDETFLGEIRLLREHMKIPKGVLPIARDGGGSLLFLDLSPQGNGRVIAFVLGLPEWTGLRTESAFLEIAKSFDEYIDKLYIDRTELLYQIANDLTQEEYIDAMEEYLDIGLPDWRKDREVATAIQTARSKLAGK